MTNLLAGSFLLGAYWGRREESLDQCATRLSVCLEGLAEISPIFDGWFHKARTRRGATQEAVSREFDALRSLLSSGRGRRDTDKSVISELGYSASLWNGKKAAAAWSVQCGSHPGPGIGISNLFVVDWPESNDMMALRCEQEMALKAMRVVVESWDPEWATWTSRPLRNAQQTSGREPVLGLLTYFNEARRVPRLDAPFDVDRLGNGHVLSIDSSVEGLMGHIAILRQQLHDTGALREVS